MERPAAVEGEFGSDTATDYLQVQLRIEPHPDANCQVAAVDDRDDAVRQSTVVDRDEAVRQSTVVDRDEAVRQSTVVDGDGSDCSCCAEVTDQDGEQRFLKGSVTARCICPVFSRHDCIESIESVENGELLVSLTVPDREEIVSIVSSIRQTGATPRLVQITGSNVTSDDRVIELEVDSVTDKQREAVRAAVESGYYHTPQKADLSDLAEQLDVSRSAVSQRLTGVESKLIERLFDAQGGSSETRHTT